MILSTHAAIGAAVAEAFPDRPVLGMALAFLSHFAGDAVPHWHYGMPSLKKALKTGRLPLDRNTAADIGKAALEFAAGAAAAALAVHSASGDGSRVWLAIGGAFFGAMPDAMTVVAAASKAEAPRIFLKIHMFLHTIDRRLDAEPVAGPVIQIALAAAAAAVAAILARR